MFLQLIIRFFLESEGRRQKSKFTAEPPGSRRVVDERNDISPYTLDSAAYKNLFLLKKRVLINCGRVIISTNFIQLD